MPLIQYVLGNGYGVRVGNVKMFFVCTSPNGRTYMPQRLEARQEKRVSNNYQSNNRMFRNQWWPLLID
jgi:hypothetical protein